MFEEVHEEVEAMDKELIVNYKAVLADQEANQARLSGELKQTETVIAALKAALAAVNGADLVKPLPFPTPIGVASQAGQVPPHLIYAGISVRWAVLCLTAERATAAMSTSEMADALKAGGVRSSSQNFAAIVSAVVSEMARKKNELAAVEDGKYEITDHGREVWDGIKHSRQYRYRRYNEVPAPPAIGEEGRD